ncbi:MAG: hypothetical protein KKF52_01720 [Nanoarchaeota archaeon]|nr:hypothetical protein [Nanoarchaeota archaeon]MBU4241927.1 hypothetical protein [Nanoarchaeota archaeon]MBU4351898.1 hypothetical protein [Nanoarchaeota archaeon]MCG2719958.1 hypothetical protein [Nanoarchaeota archaeon]
MKKILFISVNLILISLIAVLIFKNPEITGFAVVDNEEMLVKYIASIEVSDLEIGEKKTTYMKEKEVYFFLDEDKGFDIEKLIFLDEKSITVDVDDEDLECLEREYFTKKYYLDDNENSVFDEEPVIYSAKTDKDGCVAARLPKKDYRLVFG